MRTSVRQSHTVHQEESTYIPSTDHIHDSLYKVEEEAEKHECIS
jgi:hypothetical protein